MHEEITLVGRGRWRIAPDPRADIVGECRVTVRGGGLRESALEVPGRDGVAVTRLGYSPAEVVVEVRVVDFRQLNKLREFAEHHRNRQGAQKHDPIQIVHPATHRWGISEAYLMDIEEAPLSWREGYRLTLTFREWWPEPKRTTRKATAQKDGGGGEPMLGAGVSVLEADRPSRTPPKP